MAKTKPGRLEGNDYRPERPALADALERLQVAERRVPTDTDRPPPSTFPMTPAARAALQLARNKRYSASGPECSGAETR